MMSEKDALKIYETALMGYFSQGTTVPCNACFEQAIYVAFKCLKDKIAKDDYVEKLLSKSNNTK